jgi:NADH:ubiquinone oxidoreductase subunit 2 (subunit N)
MDIAPWLALLGVINSGISVGYYALVLRYMYFANPPELGARESSNDTELYVLAIVGILSVVLGLGLVDYLVLLLS